MEKDLTYVKRCCALLMLLLLAIAAFSQSVPVSGNCLGATGICTGSSYSFPAGVNSGTAESGANYGCLRTQPNPAWFFMRIKNAGSVRIRMSSNPARDIDFVLWGPFNDPSSVCVTGLTSTKIADCSYSTATVENADITNAVAGAYYIMMIANYSNRNTNITFSQTGGTGTSDCDVLCNITNITAEVSSCDTLTRKGTYALSGEVSLFSPPSTGTLTVSSCGRSVSYNAPFASTVNYSIPGITGKGDSCYVTATFSAVNTCTRTTAYAAPLCCSVSAPSTAVACSRQSLQLSASGTSGGVFNWSGPSSFTSLLQYPSVENSSTDNAGDYHVFLTYGACTSNVASVVATIKVSPDTSITASGPLEVCSGESVTLQVPYDTATSYLWFFNNAPLHQFSNRIDAGQTGTYKADLSKNGCTAIVTRQVSVFDKPQQGRMILRK